MSSKWIFILAVLLLPLLRVLVIDIDMDEQLLAMHKEDLVHFLFKLRENPAFSQYIGNWGLPPFVAAVMMFWMTERENADIPKHFALLPIVYVPFSIIGTVLATAQFELSYLYIQPLVILPFGYIYVGLWMLLVWLLQKMRLVQ